MKKLFIAATLLMLALPVGAQNLWESLVLWLKSRSVVDSSYIYQRPACFAVDGGVDEAALAANPGVIRVRTL